MIDPKYKRDPTWDNEWPNEPIATCDHCGEKRPVVFDLDPMLEEIDGPEGLEPSNWCASCWNQRKGEV